jgi:very-short-patch-repair endonuclease
MKHSQNIYTELSDAQKKSILTDLYINEKLSFATIATKFQTYANKIRRDAVKFGIEIRDKSEAQKNALETGSHCHPTKGKKRSEKTKEQIGMSVMKSWDNLSENELDARKEQSRKNWENLDQNTKDNILKMANDAVRLASKTGSKLEKYLLNKLIKDSYKVDFHKEQTLSNTKLQIDLFLPSMNIAIEVDGPSHFEPVWGDDSLKRNKKYDNKKEGLITGKGWHLIRIKQKKDFSKSRADLIYIELISAINKTVGTNSSQKIVIEDK